MKVRIAAPSHALEVAWDGWVTAASAAHELGTPLSTIAVAASELARSGDADVAADARLIQSQIERCRGLLQQMAELAPGSDAPASTRLSVVVEAATARLPSPQRVRVEWANGAFPDGELVLSQRAVVRALRNVLRNALDASPADGAVVLRIFRSSDGPFVFEVEDRGGGIAPEVLSRIAEPFFTTKGVGRGMGLGLYLTASVLESLGGHLDVDTEPGRGTRVSLTLPSGASPTFSRRTLGSRRRGSEAARGIRPLRGASATSHSFRRVR